MGRKKNNKQSSDVRDQAIPRLGYDYYGLNERRVKELQNGCGGGKYPQETLQEACAGFEWIMPWILLSVQKKRSYDLLEFDSMLGRVPCGRSDFYGLRRRFFYNLDRLEMTRWQEENVKQES